jgi:hypothetical protein
MLRSLSRRGLLIALAFSGGVTACISPPGGAGFTGQSIEVPPQPTHEPAQGALASASDGGAPALVEDIVVFERSDAGEPALPISWAITFGHTRPFADAMRTARSARASFQPAAAAMVMPADAGAPSAKQFERASSLVELCSRQFAAAYHAPDASPTDRLDALREAATALLGWSRQLDDAGLARAPSAYRTDPRVALTYEDVANGPAKRWREEGLALVHACVESAHAGKLDTPASRECAAIRQAYTRIPARRPPAASPDRATGTTNVDAGASSACACHFGDPLCSASLNGWCRPN